MWGLMLIFYLVLWFVSMLIVSVTCNYKRNCTLTNFCVLVFIFTSVILLVSLVNMFVGWIVGETTSTREMTYEIESLNYSEDLKIENTDGKFIIGLAADEVDRKGYLCNELYVYMAKQEKGSKLEMTDISKCYIEEKDDEKAGLYEFHNITKRKANVIDVLYGWKLGEEIVAREWTSSECTLVVPKGTVKIKYDIDKEQ